MGVLHLKQILPYLMSTFSFIHKPVQIGIPNFDCGFKPVWFLCGNASPPSVEQILLYPAHDRYTLDEFWRSEVLGSQYTSDSAPS